MILGAGLGTRLASIGLEVPKVLVEIGGRPLLRSQLEYLAREGVEHIVVNAYHRAEAIESFSRQQQWPLALTVVRESKLLGTAGAVRNALHLLGDDAFFVLYGDVLIHQPLAPIAEAHRMSGAVATVAVYESDDVEGKGTLLVDDDSRVLRFVEKEAVGPPPWLINAGLYLIEPGFVAELPPETERDFGHDVFPAALARGSRVFAFRLPEPVIDVGTPEGLALARRRAVEG